MNESDPSRPAAARPGADRPIGVFDSGVGGLTVVSALRRRLPDESIVYLGDTARLPYGSKSPETVTQYTRKNVAFLVERGVKAVVVACNTASALALPQLRAAHAERGDGGRHAGDGGGDDAGLGVPVWGVVGPGARAAAAATRGHVGVIATESTVRSDAYARALREIAPGVRVDSRACPLFVPLVEEGWHDDPITEEVARRYLAPLLGDGGEDTDPIDTLVLGCTHYPMLEALLQRVVGPDVTLVDSAASVAEEVARGLAERGLAAAAGSAVEHHLHVTDASANFATFARRILGDDDASLEWVEVV